MSQTMQGRRYPDNTPATGMEAGGYALQTWLKSPAWFIRDPAGSCGSLGGQFSSHAVTVHEDDTITVSPSVLNPKPGGWHGYLEHGVWREC